jgi:hypothetical protein
MSSHYLIDLFSTVATVAPPSSPPFEGAPIIAVDNSPSGQTLVNGAFVVRVPNNAALIDPVTLQPSIPQNLGDLLAKKYTGLLSAFAGYPYITFNDMLSTTGVTVTSGGLGDRGSIWINPGGTLTSTATLTEAPTNGVFTWEVFSYIDSDPSGGRYSRMYNEIPTSPGNTTAQVSFNNGVTYLPISDSMDFSIPSADQGMNFSVQITNNTPSKLFVGSWALIF